MLRQMAANFFEILYSQEGDGFNNLHMKGFFPPLTHTEFESLTKPFICEDIHESLCLM